MCCVGSRVKGDSVPVVLLVPELDGNVVIDLQAVRPVVEPVERRSLEVTTVGQGLGTRSRTRLV